MNLKDIGELIKIRNIRSTISNHPKYYFMKMKIKTKGGMQICNYINKDGLICLLSSCRSENMDEIHKELESNRYETVIIPVEVTTLNFIQESFRSHESIRQYTVLKYRIDLYFPKYKLAIECDENSHKNRLEKDKIREEEIKEELKCTFIRYMPQKEGFKMSNVISDIHNHIMTYYTSSF